MGMRWGFGGTEQKKKKNKEIKLMDNSVVIVRGRGH